MKYIIISFLALILGCQNQVSTKNSDDHFTLNSDFKTYWFDGTAEISSFKLTQYRYGEPREGEAMLIYVTEDLLTNEQVKANRKSANSKLALKLNRTKNFFTGIYPYSIMNSSFTYLDEKDPLAKITTSIQEWCGQSYLQLNKKNIFNIISHSYFEGEADQNINLKNGFTEDEIWHWIRIAPMALPEGEFEILPAFEFLRLLHIPIKYYKAKANIEKFKDYYSYEISYPELKRKLTIDFEKTVPYRILKWKEVDLNNPNRTSIASRVKSLKLPYWQLNHLGDERFRDSLRIK